MGLASSPCRQVRMAFAQQAPAFAQPHLLKALYGAHHTLDGSDVASLEAKLLQVDRPPACLDSPSPSAPFGAPRPNPPLPPPTSHNSPSLPLILLVQNPAAPQQVWPPALAPLSVPQPPSPPPPPHYPSHNPGRPQPTPTHPNLPGNNPPHSTPPPQTLLHPAPPLHVTQIHTFPLRCLYRSASFSTRCCKTLSVQFIMVYQRFHRLLYFRN